MLCVDFPVRSAFKKENEGNEILGLLVYRSVVVVHFYLAMLGWTCHYVW